MIYDCFPFFNELDLLEIRLNTLAPVVDRFVLVEANKTHTGKPKEFIFEKNKSRFAPFLHKIIHIKVEDFPELDPTDVDRFGNNWLLENFQRDAILRGLTHCSPDDIIIISDADEIASPDTVRQYVLEKASDIWLLEQPLMYYYLNNRCLTVPSWSRARIGTFATLLNPQQELPQEEYYKFTQPGKPTYFRFCQGRIVPNGGWHFSYCGGVEAILKKRSSIVEQQFNCQRTMTQEHIATAIKKGKDLYGRQEYTFGPVRLDESFPRYLLCNRQKYAHLLLEVNWLISNRSHLIIKFYPHYRRLLKILAKIACLFIPVKAWRKKMRTRF